MLLANLLAWAGAISLLGTTPLLLGAAGLAWTFGLRHGLDADHIVAIDTVTRRLVQSGRTPSLVGLFFSLGHSSVVILATFVLVGLPAHGWLERWHLLGGAFGTAVSAMFMGVAVIANARMAVGQWRALHRGGASLPATGTPATWLLRPVFRLIGRSWHMYPLGFLFGLGFDTASEIGLLGMATAQANQGVGLLGVMALPLLFTMGMALVDTLDTVLMCRAYGWGMRRGDRYRGYDLAVTLVSLGAAGTVGTIELAQGIGGADGGNGLLMRGIMAANDHFTALGAAIVLAFLALWGAAVAIGRVQRGEVTTTP
ncbi:hydrolase [Acetobacter sp. TBRC 12305]|uniref:Nickel/cobalt efflux system n=1 Tax=Acetobacter garciniae TaxID=2817435 RepID=A0A939HR10_9PROT|nr:hydrolase [Acetobacter garciniae]MBO1326497.1 hydrolase [Acetobacter garciniae]MBX0346187.1 hydrolase [Acetobacter garciniae]